jgi:hypothetical protein
LCKEAAKSASREDLLRARAVPSDCICTSSSDERIWIEVGKDVVEVYLKSIRHLPVLEETEKRKRHKVCFSGDKLHLHMSSSIPMV